MATKKVIRNIEAAINRVCEDIKNKQGGSGADKLAILPLTYNTALPYASSTIKRRLSRERGG